MKKLLALCLTLVLCLCCLTACGESKWEYSSTNHWRIPTVKELVTGVVFGYGAHFDDNGDLRCDVCGYLYNSADVAQQYLFDYERNNE